MADVDRTSSGVRVTARVESGSGGDASGGGGSSQRGGSSGRSEQMGGRSSGCGTPGAVMCLVESPVSGGSVAAVVTEVVAGVELPVPVVRFGPDPGANEWGMIPVGYRIWLWTEGRSVVSSRVARSGVSVSLRAVPGVTSFAMGDGSTVSCGVQRVWSRSVAAVGDTPCGYAYEVASPVGRPYVVTAVTSWAVEWSAAGESGVVMVTRSARATIVIGELQAIVEQYR